MMGRRNTLTELPMTRTPITIMLSTKPRASESTGVISPNPTVDIVMITKYRAVTPSWISGSK